VLVPSVLQLVVTANVVPASLILSTLMTEPIRSYEKSVLRRATRRYMSEDGILQRDSCPLRDTRCAKERGSG
jgi:hypothetical protein